MSENCQTSAGETQQGTSCAPLAGETFAAFVDTIAALRAPNGCPWDREQTHESIARNMIEEAYEAVELLFLQHEGVDGAHVVVVRITEYAGEARVDLRNYMFCATQCALFES